jgi:hypothetical protein
MTTLDPRSELIAEYQTAKSAGNQKLAMSILLQIGKLDAITQGNTPEPVPVPELFATQQAIVKHLVEQGWKSNDSTLSLHIQQRKLIPLADGTFSLADVEAYAAANLINNPQRSEETSTDKLSLEAKQLENRRLRMKVEQQEGLLVNSEDVKRELENMLVTFRSRVLLIPRKLSSQLAMMTDQHKVEEVLTRELRDCLSTLSQYHISSQEVSPE